MIVCCIFSSKLLIVLRRARYTPNILKQNIIIYIIIIIIFITITIIIVIIIIMRKSIESRKSR